MHYESVKLNPLDNFEGTYLLLYPLMSEYWEKSLSEIPEDLRARVKHVIPCWDDIGGLYPSEQGDGLLMPRQEQIKIYDMQRYYTQERETYIALHGYLNGGEVMAERGKGGYFVEGQLKLQIEKAQTSGNDVLAEFLSTELSRPLQQICDEVGIHWLNPEPLLWRKICKFRGLTLPRLLAGAERNNQSDLIQELQSVNTYLYRIINLDRDRIRRVWGELEEDFQARGAKLKSPQASTKEKLVEHKHVSKQKGIFEPVFEMNANSDVDVSHEFGQNIISNGNDEPWNIINPNDPAPEQPWYTAARYIARQLVRERPTLVTNSVLLSEKIAQSFKKMGIKKRGGKKDFAASTILKALSNVALK